MGNNKINLAPLKPVAVLVILIWAIFLVEYTFSLDFSKFGVVPRTIFGLRGIVLSPFIHGNIFHILSNTLPLLILGGLLFYFYRDKAYYVLFLSIVLSGIGTWLIGRGNTAHIGISGVIYSFATFIVFAGFYKKRILSILISVAVIILYGGLIWGLLPGRVNVSFEGHIAGAASGFFLAWILYKKKERAGLDE